MKQVIKELIHMFVLVIMCIIWTFIIFYITYAPTINKQNIDDNLIKTSINNIEN